MRVSWTVEIGDEFAPQFLALPDDVQTKILAHARLLQQFGPQLGRPHVDTLKGSRHANMKELRFSAADGAWREKKFYRALLRSADERWDVHLTRLREERK
jgi:hypothetical protein